jgi:diguanylate cyclase (GGDEF)-like protein
MELSALAGKNQFYGVTWILKLANMIINDFLTTANHDDDFKSSRAAQMQGRLQVLAAIYAIFGALWLFIDQRTLSEEMFLSIGFVRILMVAAFIVLAFSRTQRRSLWAVRIRLFLMNLIPTVFFVVCERLLENESSEIARLVYGYYPFVIVVQLAVFPLTIVEGALLALAPFVGMTYLAIVSGTVTDVTTMGEMILAMLLAALAIWAAVSQLRMLMYLYRQATRDPLTGLNNRRLLMDRLAEEEQRAKRTGQPLCLMMMDLDKFKRVNDTYGHHAGDKVLQRFAKIARAAIRATDVIGRYGGEEFVVVLPNTSAEKGLEVAERLRKQVEEDVILLGDGQEISATVSIGFAEMTASEDSAVMIERADVAMYSAKETGRNRIVLA